MSIPDVPFKEGLIPFKYQNETYQTYYKVYGDLENRTHNPLIVLHGGPGLVHQYLVPFVDLVASASIPVILYDQIGNGRSTHVHDKPPTFWTFDLFIDELLNLVSFLGIESAYDIAGHSWGGILGVELEVRRQPEGLKHLILADSLAAYSLWMQSNMQLMQALPQEVQDGLMTGMKDPAKYYAALKAFHAVHGCTIKPPPEEFAYSLDQVFGPDGDLTVTSSPILNDWTVIDRLDKVRVPTFVINGRLDIAQDFVVAPFFEKIKQVKWVTFEKSSHTPFWEERDHFMNRRCSPVSMVGVTGSAVQLMDVFGISDFRSNRNPIERCNISVCNTPVIQEVRAGPPWPVIAGPPFWSSPDPLLLACLHVPLMRLVGQEHGIHRLRLKCGHCAGRFGVPRSATACADLSRGRAKYMRHEAVVMRSLRMETLLD